MKLTLILIALSVLAVSCGHDEDKKCLTEAVSCPTVSPCPMPPPSCPPDKICIPKKCVYWSKWAGCIFEAHGEEE